MKNAIVQLSLVLIGITSVHAVKFMRTSSLHGQVFPSGVVKGVWAIHGKDTLRMTSNEAGDYSLPVIKPGFWQIKVEAKSPYRDQLIPTVHIVPGINKELGMIELVE